MATTITNPDLLEIAQQSVSLFSGVRDDLRGVTVQFAQNATYGDTVKVATVSAGENSTEADYQTDGSSSLIFKNIALGAKSKQQIELTESEYAKIGETITAQAYNQLVKKAAKGVSDAVYGLINTTNFPLSANKIVTSAAESSLTVDHIYAAVGAAIATGKFDPSNIIVVAPYATYARLRSEMDKRFSQGISMNFVMIPNTVTSVTYITDGTAAGVAIGGDPGTNKTTLVDNGIGYSLKIFTDDRKDKIVVAPRFTYGTALLGGAIRWLQAS